MPTIEKDEGEGDVSNFAPPQYLARLKRGIKRGGIPKPYIANLIALLGFDSVEDFFDELEITDPSEQNVYRAFQDLYRIGSFGKVIPNLSDFPFIMGFEFDGEYGILFLKDKDLATCIDFDW